MSIREKAETERQKLGNMSRGDKVWYIWEYYKFHLLALLLALGALWTIGGMIYRQTFTTRLSIAIINDRSKGAASMGALETGLREMIGYGKKDVIEINEGLTAVFDEEALSQYDYASLAKLSALVASRSLDVVVGDHSVIDHYETINAYENLEELLPHELYVKVKDSVYYAADDEGNLQPAAISLEGTSFADQTGVVMDPPYLAVIAGSPHKEAALALIQYLFP